MTRLPLRRAAATALALLALACERVETKSLLTDLDRLDDVESADADPDELATDTFEPEPDTGDRIDIEPDTNDIVADADDTADTIDAPDLPGEPEPDEIAADTAEPNDALPPGCRDDAPVDGCPCTGTSFHAQWGDEICDPRQLTRAYAGPEPSFRCRDGLWMFGKEQRDGYFCPQPRCIGYRYESKRETGGAVTEGWPCGNEPFIGYQRRCSDPRRSPCVCDADGVCIDRNEYEGDADTDVDLLEIAAELPTEIPFFFMGRNSR